MRTVFVFILLISQVTLAAEAEQTFAVCAACHGLQAQGNDALGAPALAAQQAAYLTRQLENFAGGIRGQHKDDQYGAQMAASIAAVDESQFAPLANYLSALPVPLSNKAPGDIKQGQKLYQSYCGSCHGSAAQGNQALNAPRLSGLSAAYLQRQYRNFLSGIRGNQADDQYGRQMAIMANVMKQDGQIKDVIAYITNLSSQ